MATARCLKCNFTMQVPVSKGPPAACPACGFTKSKEVQAALNAHKAEQEAYCKMSWLGKLWFRFKKRFRKPTLITAR